MVAIVAIFLRGCASTTYQRAFVFGTSQRFISHSNRSLLKMVR